MANATTTKSVDLGQTTKITVNDLKRNNASIVSRYSRVPEKAQAVQFQGWDNATTIINWLPGLYFVPAGYPHELRYSDEYLDGIGQDRTLKNDTQEFLVFKGSDGKDYRIDLGFYVIQTEKGGIFFVTAQQFREQYQEAIL